MLREQIRENWRQLRDAPVGRRFRDFHRFRKKRERKTWQRVVIVGLGVLFFLAGVVMLITPGPGWLILFLGLGLIATEFHAIARLLDWAEPRLRRILRWAKTTWNRCSTPAKVAIGAGVLVIAGGLGYAAWAVMF